MGCWCGKLINHVGPCNEIDLVKVKEESRELGRRQGIQSILTTTINQLKYEFGSEKAVNDVLASIADLGLLDQQWKPQ